MAAESAVLVAVRSRPLLESDELMNSTLKFCDQEREVIIQDKSFTFDYVFPPDSTNLFVYNTAVANRLEHIFNGYNFTIFAYGQTGSGKSHTMGTNLSSDSKGEKAELGIIPLSVADIFNEINNKGSSQFCVKASFLEVYKEEVYDLLSGEGESAICSIREDYEGVKVTNLTEIPVKSVDDVLNVLRKGCNARRIGATALNEYSSRSHSIFALVIEQNCGNLDTKKSKFQLIDLAGSERTERSKTAGIRFKEGVDINKGLLALGKVISGLCGEKSHIPYRDSKLTRLLMDSLGGNSYTIMIGCISPSLLSSEETLSTLRYASRARKIKNKPVVNVDPPQIQIEKLKQQVELLQSQLYRKASSMDNVSSIEDTSDVKQQNEKLKLEVNNSTGRIAAISEDLIKAEEKAGNLEEKMNSLCRDLRLYLLKHDSDEPSPALNKLFDHLKCLDLDCQDPNPDLVAGDSSDFPEQENSDEDDDVAGLEGDEIKHKLGNIELDLLKKQEIINHFETISKVVDLNECTQDDLIAMKNKIKELSQEKANLEEKLKTCAKRITDEFQKRYHECQCEIKGLQKKIFKNELMHKVKAQHQMKMEKFQQEIKELKCTRVKLIKKMKQESENFRRLQMAKERELAKLKHNERKKEREILVLRNTFDKQMNVFKHKMEKVQALNKRLNEAINKKKRVSLIKKQKVEKEPLEEWLNKELDVEVFSKLASEHYNFAKENMSNLAEKVQQFQKAGDHSDSLQGLIDLELEKLDAAKPVTRCFPEKRSERWSSINSMAEAKVVLEILFDKYASSHVESYLQNESRMSEVASLKQKLEMKDTKALDETKNLNEKIKLLKEKHELMKADYECKLERERCQRDGAVINCLKTMNELEKDCAEHETDSVLLIKAQSQEQEIQRLQERFEEYAKKCEEVEYWKEEYKNLDQSKRRRKYLTDFPSHEQSTSSFTEYKNLDQSKRRRKYLTDFPSHQQSTSSFTQEQDAAGGSALFEYLEEVAEESFSSVTDSKDPDWRMTPINKQRKRAMRETVVLNTTSEQGDDDTLPSKRPFLGCKCPGDCHTMRCACKKKMQPCGSPCSCNKDACVNILSEEKI